VPYPSDPLGGESKVGGGGAPRGSGASAEPYGLDGGSGLVLWPSRLDIRVRSAHDRFPVTSRLFTHDERDALWAVYEFARLTDDVGDLARGSRILQLDALEAELDRACRRQSDHPIFVALGNAITQHGLPTDELRVLIDANRQDQFKAVYETFDELLAYCALSAVPIGRCILSIFDCRGEDAQKLSDRLCIGLQLAEHLGDVHEDRHRGRCYIPVEDQRRFAWSHEMGFACADWSSLVGFQVARARSYIELSSLLPRLVPWRLRPFVVSVIGAGHSMLDAVECEVLHHRFVTKNYRRRRMILGALRASSSCARADRYV